MSQVNDVMVPTAMAGRRLFEDLRGAIEQGRLRDGDRLAPIRELAAKYNIAFDTARSTVGRLEQLALVRRRRGSGTFVTARTSTVDSAGAQPTTAPSVALLIDSKAHLYDHLTAELVDLFQRQGLTSLKLSWRNDEGIEQLAHLLKTWGRHPPRAAIVQTGSEYIDREIDRASGGKTVVICAFRGSSIPGKYSSVVPDYTAAYRVGAEELVRRGHTRIGFVTNARNVRRDVAYTLRKRRMEHTEQILTIAEVLRQHGLTRHAMTLHYNAVPKTPRPTAQPFDAGDVDSCARWLRERRPTAVLGNDFRLLCVQRAAESLGLRTGRGRDVELMGVGNTPWSEALGFDSVSLREDVMAKHIANLVTQQLQTPDEAGHHVVVAPKLVVREQLTAAGAPPEVSHIAAVGRN
jgi:DNA-binding LacI/PurR family transcriptional regulator